MKNKIKKKKKKETYKKKVQYGILKKLVASTRYVCTYV